MVKVFRRLSFIVTFLVLLLQGFSVQALHKKDLIVIVGDSRACSLAISLTESEDYVALESPLNREYKINNGIFSFESEDSIIYIVAYGGGTVLNEYELTLDWTENILSKLDLSKFSSYNVVNIFGVGDSCNDEYKDKVEKYIQITSEFLHRVTDEVNFIQCTIGPIDESGCMYPLWNNKDISLYNGYLSLTCTLNGIRVLDLYNELVESGFTCKYIEGVDTTGVHYDSKTDLYIMKYIESNINCNNPLISQIIPENVRPIGIVNKVRLFNYER